LSARSRIAAGGFQFGLWKKLRTGEMTTDYQAEQGKKLFGIGVFLFGHGLVWFKSPGIFTLLPFSAWYGIFNIVFVPKL
jgi:hypothetical protein